MLGSAVFGLAALQGCSSDDQAKPPATGGSGGASHAGSGGKPSAGSAGKPVTEGGAGGEEPTPSEAGMGGEMSMGGEGGGPACDLSFDNSTLTAITDNGGKLPDLP
ncbi:MAG TPA: hypothetical protein VGJ91_15545 [Polyangiaceae bacterium]